MYRAENKPGHVGVIPSDMKSHYHLEVGYFPQPIVCIISLAPQLFAEDDKHFNFLMNGTFRAFIITDLCRVYVTSPRQFSSYDHIHHSSTNQSQKWSFLFLFSF